MELTAEDYQRQLLSLQPPGQALPTAPDSEWALLLLALAEEFARLDERATQLRTEMDPRQSYELLPDWERLAGLPDDCMGSRDYGLGERRARVETRLTARGAQNRAYFIDVAARLGHAIEIEEPPVSISGALVAGDELSADATDRYAWRVHATLDVSSAFVSGNNVAGDELGYWRPTELECLLNRLKPAHTQIEFRYSAES